MSETRKMRLERLIQRLEAEKKNEAERLKVLEEIKGLPEIVILRNKKVMHAAEIDQMIRNARDELARIQEAGEGCA